MKLLLLLVLLLGNCTLVGAATPAWAQTRTGPAATQHALDELANCRAQKRPGAGAICPTDTPVPTSTPIPTWTAVPPTATPTDAPADPREPTQTPLPTLPAPAPDGDPVPGYTRPLDEHWLELALPEGRWAVYQADDCAPQVGAWSQAWLTTAADGEVDLNAPGAACDLVAAVWQSDAPCALDDNGQCNLGLDSSYWDWLGQQPTATPPPTRAPAATRVAPAPAIAPASAPVAAPAPQVRTVVQTVVMVVTAALPTDTPVSLTTPTLVPTRAPTATVMPTRSPTRTSVPSSTATLVAAIATPTGAAMESASHVTGSATGRWEWSTFLATVVLVASLGAVAIWASTRRTVVRWGARSNRSKGVPHA
jgi:hypothetical protein